jgi:hypothetical protein
VEGRGEGATISEVAFQSKHLSEGERTAATERGKELQESLKAAQLKQGELRDHQHRLKTQREVLDKYAANIVKMPEDGKEVGSLAVQEHPK